MVSTQHSALSTQHSALSTQQLGLNWISQITAIETSRLRFLLLLGLLFYSNFASSAFYCISRSNYSVKYPSVAAACAAEETRFHQYPIISVKFIGIGSHGCIFTTRFFDTSAGYYTSTDVKEITHEDQLGLVGCVCEIEGVPNNNILMDTANGTCTVPSRTTTLTLTPAPNQKDPLPDPRPASSKEKIPASSTYELIAKVMEGSTPKAGVAVTFKVDVIEKTGGHDHHDASRPKGLVNGKLTASGVTEANGEINVTFQASQIAGTHVVAAVCESCTNKSVTKNVDVKVPDLVPFLALPFRTQQWNPEGIGQTTKHKDNHYLTVAATYRLLEIASKYKKIWPAAPTLTLNDGSLKWGGKFDIDGTWDRSKERHAEHRIGDNIDIRANGNLGSVPKNIRLAVKRWLLNRSTDVDDIPEDLAIDSVNPLHEGEGEENEHFHLRLGN